MEVVFFRCKLSLCLFLTHNSVFYFLKCRIRQVREQVMEHGRGRGRHGVRYLPSMWSMEPDLSQCLYVVPRGEATPVQNIVEEFFFFFI